MPWHSEQWNLLITYCVSTTEIWARLIDFADDFEKLCNDLNSTPKKRAVSICNKQCYLVDISGFWCRVLVEKMNKAEKTAWCFYFDYGDFDWIPMANLYEIDSKYLELPAQAVRFSLFGLEDYAGYDEGIDHLKEKLDQKSLVATVCTKEEDFKTEHKVQVVLFDTSTEEDIHLNDVLRQTLCHSIKAPQLKQQDGNYSVYITHVTDDGDIILQVNNGEFKFVQVSAYFFYFLQINSEYDGSVV